MWLNFVFNRYKKYFIIRLLFKLVSLLVDLLTSAKGVLKVKGLGCEKEQQKKKKGGGGKINFSSPFHFFVAALTAPLKNYVLTAGRVNTINMKLFTFFVE